VVNGVPFEFRNITGQSRKIEIRFSDAKKKGNGVNVFLTVDADASLHEARQRISQVLERHPEYTGEIIVSIRGGAPHFWNTDNLRQKNPCLAAGSATQDVIEY